jgi:hypothetical protein
MLTPTLAYSKYIETSDWLKERLIPSDIGSPSLGVVCGSGLGM